MEYQIINLLHHLPFFWLLHRTVKAGCNDSFGKISNASNDIEKVDQPIQSESDKWSVEIGNECGNV
jgi:hypothetical protein